MKAAKTLVYEKTGELEDIEMKCRIKKESEMYKNILKSVNLKRKYKIFFIKIQKEIDLTGKNG